MPGYYWEHLAELPIPYVVGFALTQLQVDAMARHLLSEEEITASGNTYRAIVHKMQRDKARTTLVPFWRNKVEYFCYVAGVVPSFNGKNPNATIAKHIIQHFGTHTFVDRMGSSTRCTVSVCLGQLVCLMFEATKLILEKRAARARKEADKATSEAPGSMAPNDIFSDSATPSTS
ncbi:hypothetical protein CPB85DRAFT_1452258 [Mucidula mucida]|nr:hypothetical protein CPB85DRAFT_1452258 [Mucidula mucida]